MLAAVGGGRTDLIIDFAVGNQIVIQNWNSGARAFGISLPDTPYVAQSDFTWNGDIKKLKLYDENGNPPYWYYSFFESPETGNQPIMYASDGGEAGAADILQVAGLATTPCLVAPVTTSSKAAAATTRSSAAKATTLISSPPAGATTSSKTAMDRANCAFLDTKAACP